MLSHDSRGESRLFGGRRQATGRQAGSSNTRRSASATSWALISAELRREGHDLFAEKLFVLDKVFLRGCVHRKICGESIN